MAQAYPKQFKRIWSPVRQQAADSFLILMIAAFALTVILVRLFLQLSGYPQVGNATFHIAHLLWGGLLLFVALVALLTWANHWVLWFAAVAGGIGVGLFIDEVGKFITESNDYFFPLAFPIIYAFLLICVWLYLRVRRATPRDTRTLLYHALEDLKQVLDNDLDPFEHQELVSELTQVIDQAQNPNEKKLAKALLAFVKAEDVRLAKRPNVIERVWVWIKFISAQWPARRAFRWLLTVGFALAGISVVFQIGALLAYTSGLLRGIQLPEFVIVSGKEQYVVNDPALLLVYQIANVVTGLLMAATAVLLSIGKEQRGLRLGTLALALSLTVVNLLTFYFSQLYAIGAALSHFALLLAAMIYRWRFFSNR
ncbi:MAG: hypothetical protein HY741_06195 [Chloroflexi bacterium]|nr:hypothetical protein [Chloroflexota bacterium]